MVGVADDPKWGMPTQLQGDEGVEALPLDWVEGGKCYCTLAGLARQVTALPPG